MIGNMRKICFVLGLVVAGSVVAEPSSTVVWDSATRHLVNGADPQRGAGVAETCVACHGKTGKEKLRPNFPLLAGQTATYIYKQMMDYKESRRGHGIMQNFASSMTPQEIADVAAWFQSQSLPPAKQEAVTERAVKLVGKGDGPRLLPPCAACHGRKGEGAIVDIPALAGQNTDYFVVTMQAYKSGERGNDIYNRMRLIAESLSDEEIDELAAYYAALGNE